MGRLIHRRRILLRPELSGRVGGDAAPAKRPGRHAGVQLDLRPLGLGDWVETWAKPIARWIDARILPRPAVVRSGQVSPARPPAWPRLAWLVGLAVRAGWVGLPLAGCSQCSARRRLLNSWVPDVRERRAWRRLFGRFLGWLKARLTRP